MLLFGLRRRWAAMGGTAMVAMVWSATPAHAIEADRFAPAIGAGGVLELERAAVDGHLELKTGLWIRIAGATVAGRYADGADTGALSGTTARMDATVAVDLADRVTLGLAVPAVLSQDGMSLDRLAIDGGGLGDLRLLAKAMLWRAPDSGLAVALALPVTLPTGDPNRWLGADGVTVAPTLLLDVDAGVVDLVARLGYRIAPEEEIYGTRFGHAIRIGLGARHALEDQPIALGGTITGELGTAFEAPVMPFEAHVVGEWTFARCLTAVVGVGAAISGGVGAAPGRGMLGLIHRCPPPAAPKPVQVVQVEAPPPGPADRDGDGITDDVDACPDAPEDRDEFEDLDGCPDADNDKDGINDVEDPCPMDAEDLDGFEDVDGCPDPDNDKDGIADGVDQCPNRPENRDGIQDDDGCPEERITRLGRAEIEGGFIFLSEPIEFIGQTANPTDGSATLIADLAALLNRRADLKRVEIGGHTGSDGSESANERLSRQRAQVVKAALVEAGVDGGRMDAVGYGETMPIESNRTASGRKANTRIEVRITDPAPGG